jgi:DNA-binding transcriptional ArsR family regulator
MKSAQLKVNELKACASLFQTCSHPVRMRILTFLSEEHHCVFEIQEKIGFPENETSQHLQKLLRTGVVKNERIGKRMYYSLTPGIIEKISTALKILGV